MKAVEVGGGRWGTGEVAQREPALWGLVGNTPLIPFPTSTNLHRPSPSLFLKAEWLNPGGSVKDRAALFILRDGIARGELPGKRLLDASSGNTAIAYAMLGAAAGIGVTVCVPRNASAERQALLDAYGAEVVLTDRSRARTAQSERRAGSRLGDPAGSGMPISTTTRPTRGPTISRPRKSCGARRGGGSRTWSRGSGPRERWWEPAAASRS